MNSKAVLISVLVTAALAATAVQAQSVYRWVDAQGDVHYSQTPPPDASAKAKLVDVAPAPADVTAARAQQSLVKSVAAEDAAKQQAGAQAARAAAKKAQQQQACNAARQRLQQYQEAHRVVTNANSADPTYYTGDDLVKFRAQAQEQVNKLCSGS